MKKIIYILAFAAMQPSMQAQSCCSMPAPEAFQRLAQNGTFVNSHFDPIPFVLENPLGKAITYKTPDGKQGYGYEIKAAKPSSKYVLVVHEWWGLNDYVKRESDRLYTELGDVNVIAIDLYDNKVAAVKDSAAKYMQNTTSERAEAIIKGVMEYAGKNASFATVGWCFGGGWSLQAAILGGHKVKACVMYYGMPESNKEKLKNIQAPVLGLFAEKDAWISPKVVSEFEQNMKSAGKTITTKEFPADHAFANPSNPKFDQAASAEANKMALEFIKTHLK